MPCYHQLKAWQFQNDRSLKFCNSDVDLRKWELDMARYNPREPWRFSKRPLLIPCGQCIGCRLDYSHTWAVRCLLEAKTSIPDSCYFLTLTYDDEHLPHSYACDIETGEALIRTDTLNFQDLQLFMKDFRMNAFRKYGIENIRFFACGEYGSQTFRPHYHMILFNFDVPRSDLHLCKSMSKSHLPLFESDLVNMSWKRGFAVLGSMTYNSACYTAGYMLKKEKGKHAKEHYAALGIVPEGTRMSLKPGVARRFFEENQDFIYDPKNDRLGITVGSRAISPRPPAYFDRLYIDEHGKDSLDEIKGERAFASMEADIFLERALNMPIDDYWFKKEDILLQNIASGYGDKITKILR